jgi:hypothetical protein
MCCSADTVFVTAQHEASNGIIGVNRKGQVRSFLSGCYPSHPPAVRPHPEFFVGNSHVGAINYVCPIVIALDC